MKVDLHVRRMDAEICEMLRAYRYDLVLADEPPREGVQGVKVVPRGGVAADAGVDRKPRPILHVSIEDLNSGMELIKRYPNRVRCVEVDLRELREVPDKVGAFKNLEKFSSWLLRRNIPLFFSSGATAAGETVPPAVLEGMVELVIPNAQRRRCYRLFLEFLKGVGRG